MDAPPLVIVAPRLPPRACGIGTYAWQLHRHWPAPHGQERFLVFADADATRENLPDTSVAQFPASARGLAEALERAQNADVLLHYAGRAYHRFGFPRWMPEAFATWRKRDDRRRLHVIFHELPADLPLLSKQGILQRFSFPVARALAEQASSLVTNSAHHASVLNRWSLRCPVEWLPVPSNIAAPDDLAMRAPQRRPGEFAIFGLPYTRLQTVRTFRDWLTRWKQSGRLSRLHLIGPRDAKFTPEADAMIASALPPDSVVDHGELDPAAVSNLLFESEFCLSISNDLTWSKSGTLMAYAEHACAVVIAQPCANEPLQFTISAADVAGATGSGASEKGERLRQWYLAHATWRIVAKRIAEIVGRS
ncbi:MAG: hypothetical protein M3Z64_03025 [Verrucomicrobiota bacterium]|nr:hypothetical protein [Verrucomicrobiota bacterium]